MFCAEQEISRKTFYALRARARAEGQAAVPGAQVPSPPDQSDSSE